jgi:hypothetical protein
VEAGCRGRHLALRDHLAGRPGRLIAEPLCPTRHLALRDPAHSGPGMWSAPQSPGQACPTNRAAPPGRFTVSLLIGGLPFVEDS